MGVESELAMVVEDEAKRNTCDACATRRLPALLHLASQCRVRFVAHLKYSSAPRDFS
jgi:hypothetical protein